MRQKPKISVLVANYNNAPYLETALHSLMLQTEGDWEAVIVDDASTDNSLEIIQRFVYADARFKFLKNEKNIGCQRTVIKAIEHSEAEIFGRLDPDDWLAPEALRRSIEVHKRHPEIGLAYSDIVICNEKLEPRFVHHTKQMEQLDDEAYMNMNGEITHFATFKRHVYNQTEGINPFILRAEDKDIYMKMCEVAPVKRIPEPLYHYRIHRGTLSSMENEHKARYWHLVALVNMAIRRNRNLEDFFTQHFARAEELEDYKRQNQRLRDKIEGNVLLKLFVYGGHKLKLYDLNNYL